MVRNILNRSAINTIGSTSIRGTRLNGLWRRRHPGMCCLVGTRHVTVADASDHSLVSLDLHQQEQPMVPEHQPQEPISPMQSGSPADAGSPAELGRYGQPQGETAAAAAFTGSSRWAPLWAAMVLSGRASLAATAVVVAGQSSSGKRTASS